MPEYKDLGSCVVVELKSKQALIRTSKQQQVLIPYSLMHEEDMAGISVDAELDKLRVQEWFIHKQRLAT